ncbi:hypothetical protein A2U01_0044607, partial [Trifolium medium]|nr:hypothetical protein [Trifolium medium]
MIIQYFLPSVLQTITSVPIHHWFGVYSSLLNLYGRQRPTPSTPWYHPREFLVVLIRIKSILLVQIMISNRSEYALPYSTNLSDVSTTNTWSNHPSSHSPHNLLLQFVPLRTTSLNLEHSDSRTSLLILTFHTQNILERHNLLPHLSQT